MRVWDGECREESSRHTFLLERTMGDRLDIRAEGQTDSQELPSKFLVAK